MKIELTYQKSTKNKIVYGTEESEAPVQTLYVSKSSFPENFPRTIEVIINDKTN